MNKLENVHVNFVKQSTIKQSLSTLPETILNTRYIANKKRERTIIKTIKLTNEKLESLKENPDEYISRFAFDIIKSINIIELRPSWFLRVILKEEYDEARRKIDGFLHDNEVARLRQLKKENEAISLNERQKNKIATTLFWKKRQLDKLEGKKQKLERNKKRISIYIFTLGIYAFLTSPTNLNRLKQKIDTKTKDISALNKQLDNLDASIDSSNNLINDIKTRCNELKLKYEKRLTSIENTFNKEFLAIKQLPLDISASDQFIFLKTIKGMPKKKILGCYIIRNRENNKCYVGQSKDIIARLNQHFKGTEPSNIIFAKDYYESELSDKSLLFEVRIVQLSTKDEMDDTEKELIAEYDAYINGYNSTSGNN